MAGIMKGETGMCKHGRLRTVGDRLFCCECGDELPIEFLTGGKGNSEAAEQAGKPAQEETTGKTAQKKRTGKKAV